MFTFSYLTSNCLSDHIYRALFACFLTLFSVNINADSSQYQIQNGDTLSQILETQGFGTRYPELLPYIDQTIELNAKAFRNNNPDQLKVGTMLTLPPNPNQAAAVVGELVVARGTVRIEQNGKITEVDDKAEITIDSTILTEEMTTANIRLIDDSRFNLGPNSEFEIEQFQYNSEIQDESDSKDSLIARISRGVVRVISGLVGRSNKDDFQLKSSLNATIGIRGTDFTVRSCNDKSRCGDLYGVSVAVQQGGITLNNSAEAVDLNKNQFAQIESSTSKPLTKSIPKGFFDLELASEKIQAPSSVFQKESRTGNTSN